MNGKNVILQELNPEGLSKPPLRFPTGLSVDDFLGRPANYFRKARKNNYLPIVRSKTGYYYAIISIGGQKVITKEQIAEYYRKRAKKYGKYVPSRPARKLSDKEKTKRLSKSREIRDVLGKIDEKFGWISKESEGSQELADLRFLLKV